LHFSATVWIQLAAGSFDAPFSTHCNWFVGFIKSVSQGETRGRVTVAVRFVEENQDSGGGMKDIRVRK
jgi:hypothetical protein